MAHMCVKITTTRDIARQILRHGKAFGFQEFSQRYQEVADNGPVYRAARTQDPKNRQCSFPTDDAALKRTWADIQADVHEYTMSAYKRARAAGIAKEVARAVLPEGMTPSYMYMVGPLRSWMTYCDLRCGNGTQPEHIAVAAAARDLLVKLTPHVAAAMGWCPVPPPKAKWNDGPDCEPNYAVPANEPPASLEAALSA
jgi:thymidylate synthase (FAD)